MTLDEVIAREEIRNVLVRNTPGVDRNNIALIRQACPDDAGVQFPRSLHGGSLQGLTDFAADELPRFTRTRHADHQGSETHH